MAPILALSYLVRTHIRTMWDSKIIDKNKPKKKKHIHGSISCLVLLLTRKFHATCLWSLSYSNMSHGAFVLIVIDEPHLVLNAKLCLYNWRHWQWGVPSVPLAVCDKQLPALDWETLNILLRPMDGVRPLSSNSSALLSFFTCEHPRQPCNTRTSK